MPTKSAKVCALPRRILRSAARRPVVFTSAGRTQPSNILMHIKSAKTIALEQRNFAFEKFTYLNPASVGSPATKHRDPRSKRGGAGPLPFLFTAPMIGSATSNTGAALGGLVAPPPSTAWFVSELFFAGIDLASRNLQLRLDSGRSIMFAIS
jgi:hypothetical protein